MSRRKPMPVSLDRMRVRTPCPVKWDAMRQDEDAPARFCDECEREVYDLAQMPRGEIERLVADRRGTRLCVRYRRDAQGRIVTKESLTTYAPQHASELINITSTTRVTHRASRIAVGALSTLLAVVTVTSTAAAQNTSPTTSSPDKPDATAQQQTELPHGTTLLVGTIYDPNNAVIAGATVTITHKQTGATQTTQSNDEGVYQFQNIASGTYTLKIEVAGFANLQNDIIVITGNSEKRSDVWMNAAVVGEIVEISQLQEMMLHLDEREAEQIKRDAADAEDESPPAAMTSETVNDYLEAAEESDMDGIEAGLNAGLDVDLANAYGETALMFAARNDDEVATLTQRLLRAHANANAASRFGTTPVMYALLNDDESAVRIIKLLLKRGANIDHQDADGRTALMYAAVGNRNNVLRLLIAKKANLNLRDRNGVTALRYAIDADNTKAAAILRRAGAIE